MSAEKWRPFYLGLNVLTHSLHPVDVITHPYHNINASLNHIEDRPWIANYIPLLYGDVITYPFP